MDARLIIDEPARGSWNMAVDEALFQSTAACGPALLRLYRWSEPTLSIGYFQRVTQRSEHAASLRLPLVRRSTGGGAIIHDRELTYSLVLPWSEDRPAEARQLVLIVHESLVRFLVPLGIEIQRCVSARAESQDGERFLCFQRQAVNDLLLGQHKVVGSAQRRHRDALLQHGSILLARSPSAPELRGIEDVARVTDVAAKIVRHWPEQLAQELDWSFVADSVSETERRLAQDIEQQRYGTREWNEKR
jgi:lipoate-protein ligase A